MELTVAIVGAAAAVIAALAGLGGAVLGAWIAARATREAALATRLEAEADRRDARRVALAERVLDLSVEALELAAEERRILEEARRAGESDPPQSRFPRLVMRLFMLLHEDESMSALSELELAVASVDELARSVAVTDAAWDKALDRLGKALQAFEWSLRLELRTEDRRAGRP
jgi:hypothetical protein